ncbi:hypothetical protein CBM2614_U110004 [Cupriavidus taiwanensis]|nr:hypothetical protein CBM2614_U110004 [Cupriavidus taiwanensis]
MQRTWSALQVHPSRRTHIGWINCYNFATRERLRELVGQQRLIFDD